MKSMIRQILTEHDNTTHCLIRWIALLAFLEALALEAYAVIEQVPFNMQDFGIGIAAVIGAIGVAIKLKDGSIERIID